MTLLILYKDLDSFEDCLRENDIVPHKNERNRLKKFLQDWLLFATRNSSNGNQISALAEKISR